MIGVGRRGCPALSSSSFAAGVDLFEEEEDDRAAEDAGDDARGPAAAGAEGDDVERCEEHAHDQAVAEPEELGLLVLRGLYSHSIVPGGLLVMSRTTRLTSRISLIMREAICSSRS